MKLALGTVQFGMPYGVANASGRVPLAEIRKIMALARSAGMDTLDTAIAYGDAEATIGQIGAADWRVVSKLPPIPEDCTDVRRWVKDQVAGSLQRLGINQLQALLLHRPSQLIGSQGKSLIASLRDLKDQGLTLMTGVSIYAPAELAPLLGTGCVDLVQAPLNLLDRRLASSGWAEQLRTRGIEIHTRSAFLQGLLLIPRQGRPDRFARWHEIWERWDAWLNDTGRTPLEACLTYPLSVKEVDRVIIGIDSVTQLKSILECSAGDPASLPDFGEVEPLLVDPRCWNQL